MLFDQSDSLTAWKRGQDPSVCKLIGYIVIYSVLQLTEEEKAVLLECQEELYV